MSVPDLVPVNPLFYKNPQVLSAQQHGNWRLVPGNAKFCAAAIGVPIVISEFGDVSRSSPILFGVGDDFGPIALTGLADRNLYVNDDTWEPNTYVPAYVRRYPFGLASVADDASRLVLVVDVDSDLLVKEGTEGIALFEGLEPSQFTKDALKFCESWHQETFSTQAFRDALRAKNLLENRRVNGTFANGKTFEVEGFQIIDVKKLTELDDATVIDWHRKGWLASCYYHLASLNRMNDLIARAAKNP